jgi:hypothetical protein
MGSKEESIKREQYQDIEEYIFFDKNEMSSEDDNTSMKI